MNNVVKSTCSIWNSLLYCLLAEYTFISMWVYLHAFKKKKTSYGFLVQSMLWDWSWLKLVRVSVRWVAYFNFTLLLCVVSNKSGYFVLMDKISITLDIPPPHEAALTSCSHVDMCCFDFCLWNLPAKQNREQKSILNLLRLYFPPFFVSDCNVIYVPEDMLILMKL